MKKLLLIFTGILILDTSFFAQVLSPSWNTVQNTSFTITSASIYMMDVVDQNVLWATGFDNVAPNRNYNWFTTTNNGGSTYTSGSVFPDTNTFIISNIEGIDANNAWVSAYYKSTQDKGVLYHTTNGGITWTNGGTAGMFSVTAGSFADEVCFLTPSVGVAIGDPPGADFEIYRTTDGGTSWAAVAGSLIPNAQAGEYGYTNSYTKFGTSDIWFGTTKNRVYHSSNGGQSWAVSAAMTSTIGAANGIYHLAFRDANNGLAASFFGPNVMTLWKTSNGGVSWTQISPLSPDFGIWGLCSIPGTSLYASCGLNSTYSYQVISYSSDDGSTWSNWGSSNITYHSIEFVNNSIGWTGGVSSSSVIGQQGIYKYSGVPLAVENNYLSLSFDIYPNPNKGIITIKILQTKSDYNISVIDILGNEVYKEQNVFDNSESHSLNLQNLVKGIYFINIDLDGKRSSQKLIIE